MSRSFPPFVTPSHARHVIVTLHWHLPILVFPRMCAGKFSSFLFRFIYVV
ncbi:hypothetical protein CORC01_07045 [Colletotrichum orchidophilum]|uniref:Uncharacterized protein n=1 Tax=Colletotrichum orchidophilum TaxID=1209926 RepID=A0A1G4B845_9PEZI|nr:uncharacterized protein CORC01_07045 [Colletotrichum orchidophilum]OHE97630.1 hypothetical protein CORC01_07045 [Colletotrichum orchidophilum]